MPGYIVVIEIGVGTGGVFRAKLLLANVHKTFTVRAPHKIFSPAEWLLRRIVRLSGHNIDRLPAFAQRRNENMIVAAVFPFIPVAVVEVAVHLRSCFRKIRIKVGAVDGLYQHFAHEGNVAAVRRHTEIAGAFQPFKSRPSPSGSR